MTPADMRAILDHANRLIAEGFVGGTVTLDHASFGRVVSVLDPEDEVICHLMKRAGCFEVYGGEGNLVLRDPLLANVLALLPRTPGRRVEAKPRLSRYVNARLARDRDLAMGRGGRPGTGFLAHR